MIKYKGIEFDTVDELIDYQIKAEGLILANKITINPGDLSGPPPFYPRQHNPWITPIPNPNIWINPIGPTCEPNSIINTWVSTNGSKAFREAANE